MNTSYKLDAYRSHDLNIMMKTSSGDTIKMDFANSQSLSLANQSNAKGSQSSFQFSSMQSFSFSIEGNGLDAQDQKEIKEFMKTAQPFIDDFLKELQESAPNTPVTKLANQIASAFNPQKERDDDGKNAIKTNIVKLFDQALERQSTADLIEKMFADTKNLLEKTLKAFDDFNKETYA